MEPRYILKRLVGVGVGGGTVVVIGGGSVGFVVVVGGGSGGFVVVVVVGRGSKQRSLLTWP